MESASDSHSLSVDFCSIPLVLPVYLLLRFVLVSFLIIHGLHMRIWMLHQIVLCSNFDSERDAGDAQVAYCTYLKGGFDSHHCTTVILCWIQAILLTPQISINQIWVNVNFGQPCMYWFLTILSIIF